MERKETYQRIAQNLWESSKKTASKVLERRECEKSADKLFRSKKAHDLYRECREQMHRWYNQYLRLETITEGPDEQAIFNFTLVCYALKDRRVKRGKEMKGKGLTLEDKDVFNEVEEFIFRFQGELWETFCSTQPKPSESPEAQEYLRSLKIGAQHVHVALTLPVHERWQQLDEATGWAKDNIAKARQKFNDLPTESWPESNLDQGL